MNKKIIFTTGGTGGHIFPAINLMKFFSKKGNKILLITDKRGKNFVDKNSKYESMIIKVSSPTNKNFIKKIFSLIVIFSAILKSILIIKKEKPNLIFGFGGYVSFPISFASKFFKIPLVIYENNSTLGRANKKLAPIAKKILLGIKTPSNFIAKYQSKTICIGNILDEDIINYLTKSKKENNKIFSILVLGGSQGSEIFGQIIPPAIKMIKKKGFEIQINQQCVKDQKNSIINFYNKNDIKNNVFTFSNDILKMIALSDLAISRCGASATAELVQMKTPFIAVPLPQSIDNHQYLNAKHYNDKGYCWMMEQKNLSIINLFNLIISILNDKKKLENIRFNMKKNNSRDVYLKAENAVKEFI